MVTMYDRSRVALEQAKDTLGKVGQEDSLELLAATITDWEESSRYGKGIRTSVQTVKRVHNIYKCMNDVFLLKAEENNDKS